MAEVNGTKEVEAWFTLQDINKAVKLSVTTEEQLKEVEKIEKRIDDKLKELYVPCE